jgi:clan AA aspartic protease
MGITLLPVRVANPSDPRCTAEVECLVDSGAIYAAIPRRILRSIGIAPSRSQQFTLADGSHIKRDIGSAVFRIGRRHGASPVIFGERGDAALVGAVTLESLGLMLDPLKRELRAMRLLMM